MRELTLRRWIEQHDGIEPARRDALIAELDGFGLASLSCRAAIVAAVDGEQVRPMAGNWPAGVHRAFVEGAAHAAAEVTPVPPFITTRESWGREAVRRYGPVAAVDGTGEAKPSRPTLADLRNHPGVERMHQAFSRPMRQGGVHIRRSDAALFLAFVEAAVGQSPAPQGTMAKLPHTVTAERLHSVILLLETYAPACGDATVAVIALGDLIRWIETNGEYPKYVESLAPVAQGTGEADRWQVVDVEAGVSVTYGFADKRDAERTASALHALNPTHEYEVRAIVYTPPALVVEGEAVAWNPLTRGAFGPEWACENVSDVIVAKGELIVLGTPLEDDESHNCDAMGCGQSHVLFRHRLATPPAPAPREFERFVRVSDELVKQRLANPTQPVTLQIEERGAGELFLICRVVEPPAPAEPTWADFDDVLERYAEGKATNGDVLRMARQGFTRVAAPQGETERPEIICLCGSTRFYDAFQQANYDLTMTGKIVLSVGFYPHSKAQHGHGEGVGHDSAEKAMLDDLHLRKIDCADRVFVLNVGGYIGESTRREIAYATAKGKPISYLEPLAAALDRARAPEEGNG